MSTQPIEKRLKTSVTINAINGDRFERSVCASQMLEAATEIEALRTLKNEMCPDYQAVNRLILEAERLNDWNGDTETRHKMSEYLVNIRMLLRNNIK
jgi:hypothetical protein